MKRITMIVLVMAMATASFATDVVGQHGGWSIAESEGTLLDEGFKMAFINGVSDEWLAIRFEPTVRVMVMFPDYLATENEPHDATVIFVTDQIEPERLADKGFRSSSSAIGWEGKNAQRIIDEILRAELFMFRTYDYRGNSVDAVFESIPENAIAAWEALQ